MTRAWIAAGAVCLAFNLNLRAIGSRDTHVTESVALSIAADGDANVDEYPALVDTGLARGYVTRTADGRAMSNYPIVPALVAAPAYWVAVRAGSIDPAHPVPARVEAVGKLVASALTALACALLFAMVSRSPFDRLRANGHESVRAGVRANGHESVRAERVEARTPRVAVATMLAVAFGTPLWSTASQALWTHAPAAAALAAALWWLRTGEASASHRVRAGLAGAAYGLAAACRPLLIVFFAGACLDLLRARDRRWSWLAAGAALTLGCIAIYNSVTFGTPMGGLPALEAAIVHRQTHLVDSAWSGNLLSGLAGILVSPNRGLLIYAPLVIFAGIGAWRARRDTATVLRLTLPVLVFTLAWARYSVWWGGHSYGPRYACDIAIPLGLLIAHGWTPTAGAGRAFAAARAALVAWSVAVQAIGAFCYPGGSWNTRPADVDRAHERLWDWRDTQIERTAKAGLYRGTR